MNLWDWLFNPSGLTPHGFCLTWAPGLIWLHAASDAVIGLSYFSIPLALAWFVKQRGDLEYRWVINLFVAFILACGMTHMMSIVTLWSAAYGIEGLIKLATALLSVATAALLWPLIPTLVAIPSPAQLKALNIELSQRIAEQERTSQLLRSSEQRVREINSALEARVAERTADLTAANTRLSETLVNLQIVQGDLTKTVEERTQALHQRDLLLREVYHRVKNNLQIVDGMLVMQARNISDRQGKDALLGLRSRIYALGLVHQQLMTSADLQTFNIAPFLHELSSNVMEGGAGKKVSLSVEAAPLSVNLDFAIPVGLLVTELVTNSLKHAFPDGEGEIKVELCPDENGELILSVSDNGRQSDGPGAKNHEGGLGMRIVQGIVSQLSATMEIFHDKGTRTKIRLPMPVIA
jgi:two-component sensor histidine kinase